MENEIWRGTCYKEYEASNLGRIRNAKTKRILTGSPNQKGYMRVSLYKYGTKFSHRLIASAFLDRPEWCTEINHKDGDKKNNRIENLEWCTHTENMRHAASIGLRDNLNVKITPDDFDYVRNHFDQSTRKIGAALGYSHTTIRRIKMCLTKPEMDDRPREGNNG